MRISAKTGVNPLPLVIVIVIVSNRLAVVLAAEALVVQSVGQERGRSPVAL